MLVAFWILHLENKPTSLAFDIQILLCLAFAFNYESDIKTKGGRDKTTYKTKK